MSSDLVSTNRRVSDRSMPEESQGRLIEVEQVSRYLWAAQAASGRRVLDAGCGSGYGSRLLATRGAREVIGVDIAHAVLEMSAPEMPDSVRLQAGNVRKLEFEDGSFELIVCFEVIEYVDDPLDALDELVRVLAPGGLLLVSSPNHGVTQPGNPCHVHKLGRDELETALVSRLSHVQLRRQHDFVASALLSDSTYHQGDGGVSDDLALHKLAADDPDGAIYTIAMASEVELPAMRDLATLGGTVGLKEWLSVIETQAATIADKDHQIYELQTRMEERERLTELLGEAEHRAGEVPELTQRIADLEVDLEAARSAATAARLEADQLDRMLIYGRRMLRYIRPLIKPLRRLRRKLRG